MRLAVTIVLTWAAAAASAGALPSHYLRAEAMQRGMRGYGLTVLQGTKVDRFEVEVLGVLRNAMPKQHIAICRMSGAGLGKTGIIAGMSGSPIYLKVGAEHKLAGAVAYGWSFPKDPICGITPIENMHGVVAAAAQAKAATATLGGGTLDGPIVLGERTIRDVSMAAGRPDWQRLAGGAATLYRLQTPLYVSGLSPAAFAMARKEFEPLGFLPVQGGASARAPGLKGLRLEPGAALAIRMAEGDMEMDAIGTCTDVVGTTVLGFGHPMMGEGRVSVPMATAVVHLCYPSQMRSFKLASSVETVGRLTADMQAGVVGRLGESATMIPVEVHLKRADMKGADSFRLRVFDHPRLTARIIGMFLANSLLVKGTFPRENTLTYRAEIAIKGHEPLVLENVHSGLSSSAALMKAVSEIYSPIGLLTSNPFGKLTIERVRAEFEVQATESSAGIESVRLERNDCRPGETVRALVSLRTYKKQTVLQALALELPDDFPPGSAIVTVCDAAASSRADRANAPHRWTPRDARSLVDVLRDQPANRRLYIRMQLPDRGVAYKGKELPSLPPSMRSVIQSPKLTGLSTVRKSIKASVETDYVVQGSHSLPILVRPSETP